jgi:pyridoxine/pyridoxamine 5'-phosphate oxidase
MLFTEKESPAEIWKTLIHELEKGYLESDHPFRYVGLGTLGQNGPEVRTVVLREFEKILDMYVFTDFRSDKVKELRANPSATLHFYHPKKRVQIRVKAKAEIHHQDLVCAAFWKTLKSDSQKGYQSVLSPGTEISDPKEAFHWSIQTNDQFFTVLRFIPESIEALQLDGLKHLRILFLKSEGWEGKWLVP